MSSSPDREHQARAGSPVVLLTIGGRAMRGAGNPRSAIKPLIAGAGLLWTASSALAHPELLETTPRDGSTVALSPSEVRLTFNQRIEPRLSRAEVMDWSGTRGNMATLRVEGNQAIIPMRNPLLPGKYRVNWRVIGADSHLVQGTITFEVKP